MGMLGSTPVAVNRSAPEAPSTSGLAKTELPNKEGLALRLLLGFSAFLLIATIFGCASKVEKYNKEVARQEYNKAYNECWRLFSRIDPEKKKEYQECIKKGDG